MKLKAGEELRLQTGGLRILKVHLGGRNLAIQPEQGSMRVRATHHGVLKIPYEGVSRSSKQTGDPERVQSRHETDDFDTQPIARMGTYSSAITIRYTLLVFRPFIFYNALKIWQVGA